MKVWFRSLSYKQRQRLFNTVNFGLMFVGISVGLKFGLMYQLGVLVVHVILCETMMRMRYSCATCGKDGCHSVFHRP